MAHQFNFGTGTATLTPVGGGAPIPFGSITGASVDFDGDVKMLYGSNKFPDDVAVGKQKVTGKVTFGRLDLNLMNACFFGQTVAAGQTLQATNEAAVIPSATAYTVTAANAATFQQDLGVFYASSGQQLTQVAAGSEAAGKYSVNQTTGVYTFSVTDEGKAILLVYSYGSATTGYSMTINNQLMGIIPTFQLILSNNTKGKSYNLQLYSCTASKLSQPFKQDDYTETEVDFSAFADSLGRVANWSITGG
jgi:hypothetical protein